MDYYEKSKKQRIKRYIQFLLQNNLSKKKFDYEKISNIGEGLFSKVYKIKEMNTLKIFTARSFNSLNLPRFYTNIKILSQISHPFIEKYIGYSLFDFYNYENPTIFTEYCKRGSLKDILDFVKKGQKVSFWTNEMKHQTVRRLAQALSFLHSKGIAHLNIKPSNILINDNFEAVLCDFSCAKFISFEKNAGKDESFGTPLYMAPENWNGFPLSYKSDVYAFGLLLYEIFSGQLPYENLNNAQLFYRVAVKKEKLPITGQIPNFYKEIIESCLDENPDKRPTFDEIVNKINNEEDLFDHIEKTKEIIQKSLANKKESIRFVILGYTGVGKSSLSNCFFNKGNKIESKNLLQYNAPYFNHNYSSNEDIVLNSINNLNAKKIDLSEYKRLQHIGSGGFGKVFLIQNKLTNQMFAAKEFLSNKTFDFLHELSIYTKLNHQSIPKLIGYSLHGFYDEPSMIIISEYIINGSLERILSNKRKRIRIEEWNETMKLINIYRIASAINYLHSKGILHLDIKPDNILIDEFLLSKVCDFGVSMNTKNDQLINIKIIGTYPFISPEIFKGGPPTTKSDVYSFGMLLYEMMSNEYPFEGLLVCKIVYQVTKGIRPKLDSSIPKVYQKLIQLCWNDDPDKRPSFEDILIELRNNKEFIIDGVDESLYKSFINITDEELKGIDTSTKMDDLFKKSNLDEIYKNANYVPFSSNESSIKTNKNIDFDSQIIQEFNSKYCNEKNLYTS